MTRRVVDPTDPVSVAGDIHARISSYDSTAPVPSADLLEDWAEMIYAANVEHVWLVEGVARVYMAEGDTPKNKLGAVIAEAKSARSRSRQGQALAALGPAPSFDEDAPANDPGYAIPAAYNAYGAVNLPCADIRTETGVQKGCGAAPGDPCMSGDRIRKIPCQARLVAAYRTNSPQGRQRYEQRQKHLAEHRRTFTPSWTNNR